MEPAMSFWRSVVLGALLLVLGTCAWANGDNFFRSKEIKGKAEYVVFGSVKDERGRVIKDATVTIAAAEHVLAFQVLTDVLGRFRTPDIGLAIKDLGYEVDPAMITVAVEYPGYHIAHREYRGKYRQKKGAVEINFRMQRNRPS
jgi:hypothetical protein